MARLQIIFIAILIYFITLANGKATLKEQHLSNKMEETGASQQLTADASSIVPEFDSWDGSMHPNEDPLAGIEAFLDLSVDATLDEQVSFLQVSAEAETKKVHGWCEICILIMQMKERGQPHLCAGLNSDYFITVRTCLCWIDNENLIFHKFGIVVFHLQVAALP